MKPKPFFDILWMCITVPSNKEEPTSRPSDWQRTPSIETIQQVRLLTIAMKCNEHLFVKNWLCTWLFIFYSIGTIFTFRHNLQDALLRPLVNVPFIRPTINTNHQGNYTSRNRLIHQKIPAVNSKQSTFLVDHSLWQRCVKNDVNPHYPELVWKKYPIKRGARQAF